MKNKYLIVLDVDGIFTSNVFSYTKEGKNAKFFGNNDNYMLNIIKALPEVEDIFCITGDSTSAGYQISEKRLVDDIDLQLIPCENSGKYDYLRNKNIDFSRLIYVGDDLPDIKIFKECFFSATTNNALPLVKKYASYVSKFNGGENGLSDILIHIMDKIFNFSIEEAILDEK